jgi:hypothetical protein
MCIAVLVPTAGAKTVSFAPRFTKTTVNTKWFHEDAERRILEDIRLGNGGSHGARLANGRNLNSLDLRSATIRSSLGKRAQLSFRAWRTLPKPKPFASQVATSTQALGKRNRATARPTAGNNLLANNSSSTVQEIALGRFDDQDCTLYPYVYTFAYDPVTGALLSESTTLATSSQAKSAGLPEYMTVC